MSDVEMTNEDFPHETEHAEQDLELEPVIEEERILNLAEAKKEEGNTFYKQHKYSEALACYSDAINLCPNCAAYYGNRSATYIMLHKFKDGLADAQYALQLDTGFVKGYLREGKCHLALGSPVAALRSYRHVLEIEPNNTVAIQESNIASQVQEHISKAEANFEKRDYRTTIFYLDRCIEHCTAALHFKIQKAEAQALLGKYQEAQELANDILQREGMNADALYVRGMCLYYQDSTEKAFQHFQEVLRRAPDHHKAKDIFRKAKALTLKKEEGNTAFRAGNFQDAYKLYSDALSIDPNNKSTNSKLFCNRATVCSKLNKLDEAIQDCSKAIELDDTYLKAYMRRAKCYTDTELFEEAVRDYEQIYKMAKTRENKQLLQTAKLELKKSKRKDYYKILGVHKSASEDEIKKAYKKRALIHHPDRHSHDTVDKQKEEEKKFKELGEAYSILSDAKKKARYDSGQDLEEEGGMGFDTVDPNQIFQAFFGGGNMSGFSFGGHPNSGHFSHGGHSHSGGFPGFSFQFG
ncbi:dnaJ homolog subfamily C member 7-like [Biomphalaria glabrata]|uniref:DnaJ homolog subfamily C member 7 n=2 Tax=Biomphalaria TaxID=6525 RepID=A0A9U8E5I4_BIOGL|nr:dnaJ homolog subfamily C member 7-like [Biomphalaria glabrata]KAI8761325.1 dnaJ subfamily C member 7 [Biomphalaria glabrata]KAK0041854.1 dnaJ subfamily C member 7 [Biomphalaria pfeifferi]